MRIEHYAIQCDLCGGTGFDRGCCLCEKCGGGGRILIDEPPLLERIRAYWQRIPPWKRVNFVTMAVFVGALALAIGIFKLFGMW